MAQNQLNKIAVIRLSSLGDILLSTPVIRALKQKYPNSEIDFIVKEQYKDAVKFNPNISNIIVYDPGNVNSIKDELKNNGYNLIIDLQNNFRSRAIIQNINTEIKRFHKPSIKKFLFVRFKINLMRELKTIPQMYAEAADVQLDENGLDLFIPDNIEPQIEKVKSYIGLCPGSKHFTKCWPQEYFIDLGNSLMSKGLDVAVIGGKDDLIVCEYVSGQIKGSINLCNENDLFQTAANIKHCKAVVCNDSGLMHTASAVGIPVIAIFGSTVKEFGFVPYHVSNLILENKSLSCRPCSHIGLPECPRKHFKCMMEISPNSVLENLLQVISIS
jgi:heptosyltransferase-2